jgi:hypothetical protein
VGRKVLVKTSSPVSADTCIRIDCDDSLILGHVLGCWRENLTIFAAIELEDALVGLSKLTRFHTRCSKLTTPELALVPRRHTA